MPDGSTRGLEQIADQFTYGFPASALGTSGPWFVGAAKWNAEIYEGFGLLASEWQNFVSRRIAEDFAFMQRIVHCRTADQVWGAQADFWQKAVEDYGKELATMNRLLVGATNKMVAATQPTTEYAGRNVLSTRRET